jgi:uncharacterized UPF0146 family protein
MFNIKYKNTSNPHLKIINEDKLELVKKIINFQINEKNNANNENTNTKINVLNIGGGFKKEVEKYLQNNKNINYYCLDIQNKDNTPNIILGDITDKNLIINKKFDFIYSCDTFEHILNPWDATENIIKLLTEKALFLCIVPFSWRYHACCYDTFRYSHTGIRYLFERLNKIKHIFSGYKKYSNTNGWYSDSTDKTLDNKPFSECIETYYLAIKDENYIFNKEVLDISTKR